MSEDPEDGDEGMPDGAVDGTWVSSTMIHKPGLSRAQLVTEVAHRLGTRPEQGEAGGLVEDLLRFMNQSLVTKMSTPTRWNSGLELIMKAQPSLTREDALHVLELVSDFVYADGSP